MHIEKDKFNLIDARQDAKLFNTFKGHAFNTYHAYHMTNHICILCVGNSTFILGMTKKLNAFRVTP